MATAINGHRFETHNEKPATCRTKAKKAAPTAPNDEVSEKSILSAIVAYADSPPKDLLTDISADDFFDPAIGMLWGILVDAINNGYPLLTPKAIIATIESAAAQPGSKATAARLKELIKEAIDDVARPDVWRMYSTRIKECSDARKAIVAADTAKVALYDGKPLPEVRNELLTALDEIATSRGEWPSIASFSDVSLPEFPVDALPPKLRNWVEAEAIATQTPVDLPALLSLAVCASMLAKRFEVVEPHFEPIAIFTCIVLGPGNRKSAVFADASRPLKKIEAELRDSVRVEVARGIADYRQKEKRLAAIERKLAEGSAKSDNEEALKQEREELIEFLATNSPPRLPRLYMDGLTSESLESEIAAQGGRMAMLGCEGGVFDIMAGRYSKNGVGNLDVFLKGHAADDLRESRLSRGDTQCDRITLNMAYCVQPDVVDDIANNKAMAGRGLTARFWWAAPRSLVGDREPNPARMPEDVAADYHFLVDRLFKLNQTDATIALTLSPNAFTRFMQWQSEIEGMLRSGGRMEHFAEWGSKLGGATLRLAAIIHCIEQSQEFNLSHVIQKNAIEAAISIAVYLSFHAEFVLTSRTTNRAGKTDPEWILSWINREQIATFTRRDVQRAHQRRFKTMEDADFALKELEERGYIRKARKVKRQGRDSQAFEVNPSRKRNS